MAAADFTLEEVQGGVVPDGGRVGQFRAEVRDVVWVSDNSNLTADATVNAVDIGFTRILGVLYLGQPYDSYAITDEGYQLIVETDPDGFVNLALRLSEGSALDLDNGNIAAARVLFLGY